MGAVRASRGCDSEVAAFDGAAGVSRRHDDWDGGVRIQASTMTGSRRHRAAHCVAEMASCERGQYSVLHSTPAIKTASSRSRVGDY
jgi:hypothetical protein